MAQHADVNAPQADGATALHWAVFRSDKETVDLLLRAGANPKAANRDGATPLWLASINGDAAIIEALLKAGADANEQLPFGKNASDGGGAHRQCGCDESAAGSRRERECEGNPARHNAVDVGSRRRSCASHSAAARSMARISRRNRIRPSGAEARRWENRTIQESRLPRRARRLLPAYRRRNWAQLGTTGLGPTVPGTAGWRSDSGRLAAERGRRRRIKTSMATMRRRGVWVRRGKAAPKDGGGLTPLVYAVRSDDLDSVKVLLAAGADVNQVTGLWLESACWWRRKIATTSSERICWIMARM